MRNRGRTMNRDLSEIRNRFDRGELQSKIDTGYFAFITKAQTLVDVPTWIAAYERTTDEGSDETRAITIADEAVRATQASGETSSLPGVQRGGPLQKLFTTFYSGIAALAGLTAEAYARTNFRKPAQVPAFTGDVALLYVIPAILADVAKDALRGSPPPDDPEDAAGKALRSVLSYAAGSLIGVRELSAALQGFAGYSGPAGTRFWSEASRLVTQIAQGGGTPCARVRLDRGRSCSGRRSGRVGSGPRSEAPKGG